MGNRFHKKTKFLKDNHLEILGTVTKQMQERENELLNEKVDEIMFERRLLRENKKQMVQDQYNFATDKLLKKLEFVSVNDRLKDAKVENKQQMLAEKENERLNFFPFTHGEVLERQREQIKRVQQAALLEQYEQNVLNNKTYAEKKRRL